MSETGGDGSPNQWRTRQSPWDKVLANHFVLGGRERMTWQSACGKPAAQQKEDLASALMSLPLHQADMN